MKKRKLTIMLSLFAATCLSFALSACGEKKTECEKNGHSFSTEWTSDTTDHWHKCANCNEISEKSAHVYDNDVDATCNTCGYERAAHTAHTAGTVWENDETNHWHVCTASGCEEKLDTAAHTWNAGEITTPATFTSDGEKTYTCTVCEKTKTETVAMEYIDVNYVESDAEQTKVTFTVPAAGTYYFRYEVKDCGFANGYYWINMYKVGGGLQKTDTTHAQAKIYDANKQLVKEGLKTQAPGQFMAVVKYDDAPQTLKGLMENGVKYLEMPFVTAGEYEMVVTHYAEKYATLEYSGGSFSKTNAVLWDNSYNYFQLELTDDILHEKDSDELQLGASPATGLTWKFVDANGNPVEKQDGDSDTYYSALTAGTYYIVIYTETKQTGVTVSADLV